MSTKTTIDDNTRTAILIDGGFYRKRAYHVLGDKSPGERADELDQYCHRHLIETINGIKHRHQLYRIFYYDCPPSDRAVFNPVTRKNDELGKSETYRWAIAFFEEIKKRENMLLD